MKSRGGKSQRREEKRREETRREEKRREERRREEKRREETRREEKRREERRREEKRREETRREEKRGDEKRREEKRGDEKRREEKKSRLATGAMQSRLGRWEMKNCTPLWREAHFQVKMLKTPHARTTFEGSDVVLRGRCKGFCTMPKVSKTWGFCNMSKNDGRRGTFAEDLQRCISRGRRSTRDMFIRDVRRSGRWFPEGGCILEHQIFRFAKMILRDRCSTSYDLASFLRGRRSTLHKWNGKSQNTLEEAISSALKEVSQICFVFDAVKIVLFLMLSSSKIEEVSQNCFVLDVVKCKKWGSLAELFRFWRCQVQ